MKLKYAIFNIFLSSSLFLCFFCTKANADENSDGSYKEPNISLADTVHVSNADDFLNYIYTSDDGEATFANEEKGTSHIHKIILDNDINLADGKLASNLFAYNWKNCRIQHGTLVIDGNGHNLDMGRSSIAIRDNENENWTLKNIQIESASYWGPISVNTQNTTINYSNIKYFGSQLIWSSNVPKVKVNFYGNNEVHSLYQYTTYTASNPSGSNILCDSSGNQQNMQVGTAEFHKNSTYYGETYNGNCLELYGAVYIDDNAKVDLHPHGTSAENGYWGTAVGVYLNANTNYTSSITTGNNATMNVISDNSSLTGPYSMAKDPQNAKMIPNNPDELAMGIYADTSWGTGLVTINLNKGSNSSINVLTNGDINNNYPSVLLNSMNTYISKENALNISLKNSTSYNPTSGVVSINGSNSNVLVDQDGTFTLTSDDLPGGYLLNMPQGYFKIVKPKHFLLSNSNSSNNYLLNMNSSQFIDANDVLVSAKGTYYKPSDGNISLDKLPVHRLYLPTSGRYINNQYMRTLGTYSEMLNLNKQFSKITNNGNGNLGKQFNTLEFFKSPTPNLNLDATNNYVTKSNRKISGTVKDEDGNALKDAYVRIYLDEDKDLDDSKYIYPDSISSSTAEDVKNIVNSKEILSSISKRNFPNSGASNTSGTVFKKTLDVSDFSKAESDSDEFNKFNNFLNSDTSYSSRFNGISTVNKSIPFVAVTDSDGVFSFDVPDSVWDKIGDNYSTLDLEAYFNGASSSPSSIDLNNVPQVSITNTTKNLTYPRSNVDTNKLKYVYQGSSLKSGDNLEFCNILSNDSKNVPLKNFTYVQPVPSSMDIDTLQILYQGGGYPDSINSHEIQVVKDTQNPEYKLIYIKNINLPTNTKMYITVNGNLENKDGKASNKDITFSPSVINSFNGNVTSGSEISISYSRGDDFSFQPSNISFGNINSFSNKQLIGKSKDNLMLLVNDDRREKSNIKIMVQQENSQFIGTNKDNKFNSSLLYKKDGTDYNLNAGPVTVLNTNLPQSVYLDNNNKIFMNHSFAGQKADNYKTMLTWTYQDSL